MNNRMLSRIARAELKVGATVAARTPKPGHAENERGKRRARLLLACPQAMSLVAEVGQAHAARKSGSGDKFLEWVRTDPWAMAMLTEADRLTMSVPNRAAILAGEAYR